MPLPLLVAEEILVLALLAVSLLRLLVRAARETILLIREAIELTDDLEHRRKVVGVPDSKREGALDLDRT